MNAKLLVTIAILLGATGAPAQGSEPAAQVTQGISARREATDFMKAGNPQAGLAQLRSAAKQGGAAKPQEVQVVGELCTIARTLTVEKHPSARDTVLLAANEAGSAKAKISRADAADLDAQIGELYERCLGDGVTARQYYNSAVAQDGTRPDASEGLRRLDRFDALVQAKAQENATLRARGK